MPRVVVIVDTNLYRGMSDRVVEDLRWLEGRADVQAMASFHATTELLAHVSIATDSGFRASRAALKRLWAHCSIYSLADSSLPFAPDLNGILARTLFDTRAPWSHELVRKTTSIVRRIALSNVGDALDGLSTDLGVIRRFRDDGETRFATTLAEIRRQLGLDSNAASDFPASERPTLSDFLCSGLLRSLGARTLVMNCASELRLQIKEDRIVELARILELTIPTALAVFESAVVKVVSDKATPKKHANSYWDFQLAFFAADSIRVSGRPVIVVTEDKPVRSAAAATGAAARVLSLDEYRAFLLKRLAA